MEQRQSTICELTFVTAILAVKLNRKRLVVVLEEHIYIYDIGNMKLLNTIDTSPNPNGNIGSLLMISPLRIISLFRELLLGLSLKYIRNGRGTPPI
jgi:hypothetical protein